MYNFIFKDKIVSCPSPHSLVKLAHCSLHEYLGITRHLLNEKSITGNFKSDSFLSERCWLLLRTASDRWQILEHEESLD